MIGHKIWSDTVCKMISEYNDDKVTWNLDEIERIIKREFGPRLRRCIREKGLTVCEFADMSGVSLGTIYKYKKNAKGKKDKEPPMPKYSTLVRCAVALGVSADYLLGLSDEMLAVDEDIPPATYLVNLYNATQSASVTPDMKSGVVTICINDAYAASFFATIQDDAPLNEVYAAANFFEPDIVNQDGTEEPRKWETAFLKNFGLRFLRTLKEREYTQASFADLVYYGEDTIKKYSRKKNPAVPSLHNLVKYAGILNVSIDYLLGLSENAEATFTPGAYLLNLYRATRGAEIYPCLEQGTVTICIRSRCVAAFFNRALECSSPKAVRDMTDAFNQCKFIENHLVFPEVYEDWERARYIYGDIGEEDFSMFPEETYALVAVREEKWEASRGTRSA